MEIVVSSKAASSKEVVINSEAAASKEVVISSEAASKEIVASSKAASKEVDIPVKLVIDKEKERVVFAEADGDFADILFSFLTLPMGTIVRLLANHSDQSEAEQLNIGNFNTLSRSVRNLDAKYFVTDVSKDLLANTKNFAEYQCQRLKINIDDTEPADYFICPNLGCTVDQDFPSLSTCNVAKCRQCREYLNMPIRYEDEYPRESNDGVFFAQTASFIVTDDLNVFPNTVGSVLEILDTAGISDFGVLEETTVQFGSHEILELLKYSILSKTPLTDMFFGKKDIVKDIVPAPSSQCQINTAHINDFRNKTVKVVVQKSTKKILLAQAAEDFVEFLFGFLAMPLGRIVTFLGESFSSNGTVENLHNSLSNLDVGRHFKFDALRNFLLYPEMDFGSYHSLYFRVEWSRDFYYGSKSDCSEVEEETFYLTRKVGPVMKVEHPKEYVRGPTMFLVTDDLVVTPFSSMSCITYLHSLKVSPGDVEEHEINIGPEEALNILRACMISTSVLNNGLKSFMPKENGSRSFNLFPPCIPRN
ncbi:hypothetical protein POM88_008160 [Heracleum sosnowskyi]|uniref:DUF674 family protein n=1 Tax=Heracleum sosnowskyi TaxID=360622 RepID=A0AAD8N6Z9_9APIA|nr:hypothetical protein POM88_008160 [Heracleum sosnowskyi]